MAKRIAFYMTTVLEHPGGCEKYMIETAAAFAKNLDIVADVVTMDDAFARRMGIVLSIFFAKNMRDTSHFRNPEDVKKQLGKAHYYKAHSFKELKMILNKYDIIYSKNELLESFLLRFMVGYKNIPPVVFGGHTPLKYPSPQSFHAKLHNTLYDGPLYRFLAAGVSKFHVINNYESAIYKRLFPGRQVTKIYNPFDSASFKNMAQRFQFSRVDTFNKSAINILWVGRLTEQKGVADLAFIIPQVNRSLGERIQWNICGDGEQRQIIEGLATQHSNVRYLGQINPKYMASIYRENQIFISTSLWEGYPYTLVEAQVSGLQTFAYRIPGAEDILSVYEGGHLADDKESMVALLKEQIKQWQEPNAVPRGVASDQFRPESIYGQLRSLLEVTE